MKSYIRYRIKLAQEMDAQGHASMDAAWNSGVSTPAVPLSPEDQAAKRKQFLRRLMGYSLVSGGGYVLGASTSAALAEALSRSRAADKYRAMQAAEKMRAFGPYIGLATGAAGLATALMWANARRKAEEDSNAEAPSMQQQQPEIPVPPTRPFDPRMPAVPVSRIFNKMRVGRFRSSLMDTMMEEPKPEDVKIE